MAAGGRAEPRRRSAVGGLAQRHGGLGPRAVVHRASSLALRPAVPRVPGAPGLRARRSGALQPPRRRSLLTGVARTRPWAGSARRGGWLPAGEPSRAAALRSVDSSSATVGLGSRAVEHRASSLALRPAAPLVPGAQGLRARRGCFPPPRSRSRGALHAPGGAAVAWFCVRFLFRCFLPWFSLYEAPQIIRVIFPFSCLSHGSWLLWGAPRTPPPWECGSWGLASRLVQSVGLGVSRGVAGGIFPCHPPSLRRRVFSADTRDGLVVASQLPSTRPGRAHQSITFQLPE